MENIWETFICLYSYDWNKDILQLPGDFTYEKGEIVSVELIKMGILSFDELFRKKKNSFQLKIHFTQKISKVSNINIY